MTGKSGYFKKNLTADSAYLSFVPADLPPDLVILSDGAAVNLLVEANKRLALLDGLVSRIPDVGLFISMYVRKEALMSSQIEGTQATLEDIFDPFIDENANQNVADVINYVKATEFAVNRLKELPLCNRLICETHAVLMAGVRGQEKTPGAFRKTQNWIGGVGGTLKTARYIPPNPEDMNRCMNALETYMNRGETSNDLDYLIQTALIHYQFETIHPFLDGNGRIGRLLTTLFLMEKRILSAPVLYISYALKRNQTEYYDRLTMVRERGDYEQWVRFFLSAALNSASDAVETVDKLVSLRGINMTAIKNAGRSKNTLTRVFEYIEKNPIIEINKTAAALDIAFNTASNAVNKLCGLNILKPVGNARRNRTFIYADYVDILKNGT